MKISAKVRYGLFSVIDMASLHENGEYTSLISLSEKFKISKIYLEQVFSALKKSGIVLSAKGSQGGYKLSRKPKDITVFEIMKALEIGLFENTEKTLDLEVNNIEEVLRESVYNPLDSTIEETLKNISLYDLVESVNKKNGKYMYYI